MDNVVPSSAGKGVARIVEPTMNDVGIWPSIEIFCRIDVDFMCEVLICVDKIPYK